METRLKALERRVLMMSIINIVLLVGVMVSLFHGPLLDEVRLSSSIFGTSRLSEGKLEISDNYGNARIESRQLSFDSAKDLRASIGASLEPELRLSLERMHAGDRPNPKKPMGAAQGLILVSNEPQWDRYQALLSLTDDLGEWRGNGNNATLASNVSGTPMLQLHSYQGGEAVLRFDEKGEPYLLLKAPDGRERRIGLNDGKKDK